MLARADGRANNERLKMLRSFYAGCGGGADRDRLSVTIAAAAPPATRDYSISPLNADN